MSSLGFKTVVVYHGEACLGEMEVVPVKDHPNFQFPNNEIRIHHLSPPSERCPPLSVLQTISSFSVRCKLQTSSSLATPPPIATSAPPTVEQNPLTILHSSCFYELKTAVVITAEEEIHLVAMPSKQKKFPSFWCFAVPLGLYDSCLAKLNLRCLAIVFDLDETLIVANTMKSFEDRIEALRAWITRETDPVRASGMSAELKRYIDDRLLLKQYTENDFIADGNGKVFKIQMEEVPQLSDSHEKVVRPVIRLQERNIVLTRINPEIRDTSVLVRLRPAWEDLRSYLTARGRKRFEVYVCTMAERDYALEMWRLLDPEAHLINTKQLLERVVCVKSGSRKSLSNVFQAGMCHPKMAMVIDDRSKVWEDKDQPRVHVVPPFTPYYAPQAEMANAVPVLCVARNVACNVRGYFFKEFDENLIRRISEVFYEDEVMNLPATPDVSNYMMSEDAGFVPNGNGNGPMSEGMSGVEVERRFNQLDEKSPELTSEVPNPPVATTPNTVGPPSSTFMPSHKPSLLGAPVRRDLRNQTSGQPPLLSRVPVPISSPSVQTQNRSSVFGQESDSLKSDKQRALQNPFAHSMSSSGITGLVSNASQVKSEEVAAGSESQKQSLPPGNQPSEVGVSQNHASSNNREFQNEAGRSSMLPSHLSIEVLREIGRRCSSEVEFRSIVSTSKDLQFSVEVLFTGEKIGVGMGKTKKIAQQQAAENALHCLAEKYMAYIAPLSGVVDQDFDKLSLRNENGFVWDGVNPGPSEAAAQQDGQPTESTTEAAEAEAGSASNLAIPQLQRHASSPRLSQYISNKRSKEEPVRDSQSLSSSRQQKNGHHVL